MKCAQCKNELNPLTAIRVPLANRGGRNGLICPACKNKLESYFDVNTTVRGKSYVNPWSYSIELETMQPTLKGKMELLNKDFLPTKDCTVDAEFKSPIFTGMKAPVAICKKTIQPLLDNREIVIDSHCGTHFHVGFADNSFGKNMRYIRRFYHSLFMPLYEAMAADPDKVKRVFGRNFGGWADGISWNCNPMEHCNFINVQHDNTLEFRLMFFYKDYQYIAAMHLCRKITETVVNNFCANFNLGKEEEDVNDSDPEVIAYRKHKANVAAQKLVRLWNEIA